MGIGHESMDVFLEGWASGRNNLYQELPTLNNAGLRQGDGGHLMGVSLEIWASWRKSECSARLTLNSALLGKGDGDHRMGEFLERWACGRKSGCPVRLTLIVAWLTKVEVVRMTCWKLLIMTETISSQISPAMLSESRPSTWPLQLLTSSISVRGLAISFVSGRDETATKDYDLTTITVQLTEQRSAMRLRHGARMKRQEMKSFWRMRTLWW